jgi:hypothetical protein
MRCCLCRRSRAGRPEQFQPSLLVGDDCRRRPGAEAPGYFRVVRWDCLAGTNVVGLCASAREIPFGFAQGRLSTRWRERESSR